MLGPYGFYANRWSDGTAGGGYYTSTDTQLSIVEWRAMVTCSGNQITFTTPDQVEQSTFSIAQNKLTINFPDATREYIRVSLWG